MEVIAALTEISRAPSFNKFKSTVVHCLENYGVGIKELEVALDLNVNDPKSNIAKLKKFYYTEGKAERKRIKAESCQIKAEIAVDNIIYMALEQHERYERQIR